MDDLRLLRWRGEAALRHEIGLIAGLETGSPTIGAGPFASEISVAAAARDRTSA